jgi:hypothetical protein
MASAHIANKYDSLTIKQTFDDISVEVLSETYKEDLSGLAISSVLGITSVVAATIGQFLVPFPSGKLTLTLIIVANLIITSALQIMAWINGTDLLFASKASKFRPNPIIVTSHMDRFSIDYTITISSKTDPKNVQKLTEGANAWIRADGSVDKDAYLTQFRKTLHALESSMLKKQS